MTGSLVFQGGAIHVRDELVNLTDMWRAAGSDRAKRPVDWLRLDHTVALLGSFEKVGLPHLLVLPEKGRGGATWADRRLAIAYGEYLSPDFHAWCLTVLDRFFTERAQGQATWGEGPAILRYLLRPPGDLLDHERVFEPELVRAINRVYGVALDWESGSQPRYLGRVWERMYPLIVSSAVYSEMKRRIPKPRHGSNLHQTMTDVGHEALRQCLRDVHTLASVSQDREDFWSKLDVKFRGGMLQLALVQLA